MKTRFLVSAFLLLLFTIPAAARQGGEPGAHRFRFSSYNTPFGVQGDFEGEYRLYPGWVEVVIERANVRVSEHCPYQGRRLLSTLRFGLAARAGERGWKIAREGQEFALQQVLRPGDETPLGELYFHIRVDDSVDLSQHWLVAQIEDVALDLRPTDPDRLGYAFAHSPRDLFAPAH